MKYNTKLKFYIPLNTKIGEKIINTVHSDFQQTLIGKLSHECDCKIQLSNIKIFKFNGFYDESILIVYCDNEDAYRLTDIFLHLICEFHSDLLQEEYHYGINDILVTVSGVANSKTD